MDVTDIMYKFSQALAKAVKKARTDQGLTQQQVANMILCNVRTVLKIENCQGNPKMETICLLIQRSGDVTLEKSKWREERPRVYAMAVSGV